MIFKNIIKLILLIPFFLLSCKSLDLISKKEEKIINYNDIIETSTNSILNFFNVGQGKYFPVSNESSSEDLENYLTYFIEPGEIYRLVVVHDMDSVVAETSVPAEMNIRPASLGDYVCPDGIVLPTNIIDVNNLDGLDIEQLLALSTDPET